MRNIDRHPTSLVELFRRARIADQRRRGDAPSEPNVERGDTAGGEIVGRRDERGTPYPGDFPNDLGRHYRGCF